MKQAEKIELYWKLYQENMNHAFHHEEFRSKATNFILIIGSAIIGLITFDNSLTQNDLFLSILVIILGIYGSLLVSKHHERFILHYNRAEVYKKALSDNISEMEVIILEKESDKLTKSQKPFLNKLRLRTLWLFLQIILSLIGITITILILIS